VIEENGYLLGLGTLGGMVNKKKEASSLKNPHVNNCMVVCHDGPCFFFF
jgi:hypothetical protein